MASRLPISVINGSYQKMATLKPEKEAARRTGNYKASICDNDFIQSLSSDYGEARFRKRAEDLKEYVRNNLLVERSKEAPSESWIELIDTLQRLGLGYLFEDEIRTVLVNIQKFHKEKQNNLYYASLRFRILRQHGFFIPQDEFTPFLENGRFKEALGDDTRAMLSLYDASYLSMEGETLLDDAREFATRHLKQALTKGNLNSELSKLVERGLEFPYYWKLWIDLCNSYLVEARWFHKGYTPSLDEYLNNGWISVAGPLVLILTFLLMNLEITEEKLFLLNNNQDVIYPASYGGRLQDDLGTSNKELERGDVPKAVQCYMHEKGVSENAARKHIEQMIDESWKNMNRYLVSGSSFPRIFVQCTMDAMRITQWFYSSGDGFGFQRDKTFDQFKRLVVEPIL